MSNPTDTNFQLEDGEEDHISPQHSPTTLSTTSLKADTDEQNQNQMPSPAEPITSQRNHRYAHLANLSDEETPDPPDDARLGESELDPLNYPPAPAGYYQRAYPTRIVYFGKLLLVLIAIGLACVGIAGVIDVSTPSIRYEPGRDEQSVADTVLAAMDRSADPCENFYEYACGSWLRTASIPLDRSKYIKSFSVVHDMIQLMVKELLEGDLQGKKNGKQQKVVSKPAGFYSSCIDQMGIGGLNTLFVADLRDHFSAISDSVSVFSLLAKLHMRKSAGFFDVSTGIDEREPDKYALYFGQGGLGLPHKDNYFSTKDADVKIRDQYVKLIGTMLTAAGKSRLIPRKGHDVLADQILQMETKLANVTLLPEDLRDPEKSYNKVKVSTFPEEFGMQQYLQSIGVDEKTIESKVVIDNPAFFQALKEIMIQLNKDESIKRVVRGYLAFHLIRGAAKQGLMGKNLYEETFKFSQLVYGTKQLPEQWKFCQTLTNRYLGEAVGEAFVQRHFPENRKDVAQGLATEITRSFGDTLKGQTWMDEKTRNAAMDKLSGIQWKVGYSEKLDTYDDVIVSRSFQLNVKSASEHRWKKKIEKLGKPIDKTEWFMLPQEVNAYYSPSRNEMVFPSGILQQPFFSDAYPDAMNYGSIGAVIGHEMSHGFDDQGRKYDKTGKLTSWWSKASVTQYTDKAKCYIDLFDTYKPRDVDIHVKGNLTLGENLADTNGVAVAYRAFKSTANNTEDGIPPPNKVLARELSNDQLFFVAYAQMYCTLYHHQALKVDIMTNPHSPGMFRVQGPLSQNEGFAKAFSCRNGSRYNPVNKCHLWER